MKISKKAYKQIKNVATKLIPTDWDELIWDIAEGVFSEQITNMINDAIDGEEEQPQGYEQTTYVNNYYINNNQQTLFNNRVLQPLRPPNYSPTTQYQNFPPPPPVVPSRLPTEIDNQTGFSTSTIASISLPSAVFNQSTIYGKLRFNPRSRQKKGIKRELNTNEVLNRFVKAQQDAIQSIDKFKQEQPIPLEHTGYLVATKELIGLRGQGTLLYGINSISALAQSYRLLSAGAFIEPTNDIPIEYEKIKIKDEYKALEFRGEATNLRNGIWTALGYSEKDFKKKSFEQIIKEFGEKIYKPKNKNIPNTIEDLELDNDQKFLTYLIASLFFRSGFHRFPAKLPQTLLFDNDKINNPSNDPTVEIDDALEWQEYLLKNLDALIGQFPINFTYKTSHKDGNTQTNKVKIPNIAEALAEIMGSAIATQSDTNTSLVLALKSLAEIAQAKNAAIVASDIARANAEYLGYRTKEVGKEIPYTFTPGQTNIRDAIQPSKQKIISLENQDQESIFDDAKAILALCQIIKSALVRRFEKTSDFFPGDDIRKAKEEYKKKYDQEWDEFLKQYSSQNQQNSPNTPFPNAKIKEKKSQPPTNNP